MYAYIYACMHAYNMEFTIPYTHTTYSSFLFSAGWDGADGILLPGLLHQPILCSSSYPTLTLRIRRVNPQPQSIPVPVSSVLL